MAVPIATLANGSILMSDGTTRLPMSSSTNKQAANYRIPASSMNTTRNAFGNTIYANTPASPTRNVLGISTGSGSGASSVPPASTPSDPSFDLLYQAWRSAIDQANRIRSSGEQTFNDLINAVNAFRNRAKILRDNAGQEITNRFAEIFGNTATMGEQAALDAARRGRALGLGDSSKFRNQNLIQGNLALQQGSNLAKRGENERANEALFQERQDQAQSQENEANRYLRDIRNYASGVETQGMQNFGDSLNALIQRAQALSSLRPLQAGSLQQYQPDTSGMTNVLNSLLSNMASRNIQGGDMAVNAYNPVDLMNLLRNRGLINQPVG